MAALEGNQAAIAAMTPVPPPPPADPVAPNAQPQLEQASTPDGATPIGPASVREPAPIGPPPDPAAQAAQALAAGDSGPAAGQATALPGGPDLSEADDETLAEVEAARGQVAQLASQFGAQAEVLISGMLAAAEGEVQRVSTDATTQSTAIATATTAACTATSAAYERERGVIMGATSALGANVQSSISGDMATVEAAGSTHATALSADFDAGTAAIGDAATAAAGTVTDAASAESTRAGTEIQGQADGVNQQGESAKGSYGSDEKGAAQGEAAAGIAAKGVTAVQKPKAELGSDLSGAGGEAGGDLSSRGSELGSEFGAVAEPATQTLTDAASQTTQAMSQLQSEATAQLSSGGAAVVASSTMQEQAGLQSMTSAGDGAVTEVGLAADAGGDAILRAAQETAAQMRQETADAIATVVAIEAPEPDGVAAVLDQALVAVQGGTDTFAQNAAGGASQFADGIAQYGASVDGTLGATAGEQDAAAIQTSAQGQAVLQQAAINATSESSQGAAEASSVIGGAASETLAENAAAVQGLTAGFDAAAQAGASELFGHVDATVQANEGIASKVAGAMSGAATKVGASHSKTLLDKAVDAVKSAWNAVAAVLSAVASVVLDALAYVAGALLQVLSNCLFGFLDPLLDMVPNAAFHSGRDLGERISLILSVLGIIGSIVALFAAVTFTTVGGGAVSVGSGGLLAKPAIGVTVVVNTALLSLAGVLATVGVNMMSKAFDNGGGKNSKHANKHKKNVASEKYADAKKRHDALKSKPNKTKADSEALKKAKKDMDHWKKKADFSGESHSQNAKGNR